MLRSTDRIRTTHVGSLARPPALLDLMRAAAQGRPADAAELAEAERRAVTDVVARQRAAGLDMISDGEQTKTGFYAYIGQRLSGFEPRPAVTRWRGSGPRSTASPGTTRSTSRAR
jgi:5-methyltetrahydropteroyltriglutamate--homocysteine methyltransferase